MSFLLYISFKEDIFRGHQCNLFRPWSLSKGTIWLSLILDIHFRTIKFSFCCDIRICMDMSLGITPDFFSHIRHHFKYSRMIELKKRKKLVFRSRKSDKRFKNYGQSTMLKFQYFLDKIAKNGIELHKSQILKAIIVIFYAPEILNTAGLTC